MMRLPVLNNEDPSSCGPCGGKCCKSAPGTYHPDDFAELAPDLSTALDIGSVTLDCWDGDFEDTAGPSVYYVRPPVVGKEGQRIDAGWGGRCTFLRPTGCALRFDRRPQQCRDLVPVAGNSGLDCHYPDKRDGDNNKAHGLRWWLPYQELLRRLARGESP